MSARQNTRNVPAAPIVDFVNQFYAHYRAPVIRELNESGRIFARWLADDSSASTPDVPALRVEDLPGGTLLRSRRLRSGLYWQSGLVLHAFRTDAQIVVLTGDILFLSNWLAAIVLRFRRKQVLMWTHGWTRPDSRNRAVMKRAFYSLADGLLVYGRRAQVIGVRMGYNKPIHVIGNSMGAELGTSDHLRPETRGIKQRWCVMSRLIPSRRIELVFEAMSYLQANGNSVSLTVVGEGSERGTLESEARRRGLDVAFLGAVYESKQTAEILASHDILVSPGNIGLAAIHALSNGCPVATHGDLDHQMPEAEAIQDGITGVLFRDGDAADLADKAWKFVSSTDPVTVAQTCESVVAQAWTPHAHAIRILDAITSRVIP